MGSRDPVVRTTAAHKVDNGWEAVAMAASGVGLFAGWCWRFRTEWAALLVLLLVGPVLWSVGAWAAGWLGLVAGGMPGSLVALLPVVVPVAGLLGWGRSRRWLWGRWCCAKTRRRIQAVLRETRVPDSLDRLPVVRRSRSTAVGERLHLRVRPGQSAELLTGHVDALRAGARAREVIVTRDRARADRVSVDVIRRDLLATASPLASPLLGLARHLSTRPAGAAELAPAAEGTEQ